MSNKSIAKASGLKSTFKTGKDTYLMTSFGRGNTALAEKDIKEGTLEDILHTFSASLIGEKDVRIQKNKLQADVQLPVQDHNQLQAKSAIEKIFFGASYEDNLHVQIAYNVMDIKKLITVYANNIVFTVNNLLRIEDEDFLGVFGTMNDFEKAQIADAIISTGLITRDKGKYPTYYINKDVWNQNQNGSLSSLKKRVNQYKNPNITFFQNVSNCIVNSCGFREFSNIQKAAKSFESIKKMGLDKCANYFSDAFSDSKGNINLEFIYESFRLLGSMRQTAFHSYDIKGTSSSGRDFYSLFDIDVKASARTKEIIDTITGNKLNALNDNFVKTNTVNLNILFSAYPHIEKKELVKQFYDFSVRKVFKNMGFSVKNLREAILANEPAVEQLNGKKYDSVRSKLYSLMDFVIYNYYLSYQQEADDFIEFLRMNCVSKREAKPEKIEDEKKQALYSEEAARLWKQISGIVLKKILPAMDKVQVRDKKLNKELDSGLQETLCSVVQTPDDLSYFAKAMYCISAFLDGKEINMFLDSMINSFDNIESLREIAGEVNCPVEFNSSYSFFNHCGKMADELRFIKSIARMNKGKKASKNSSLHIEDFLYFDSAAILGEYDEKKVKALFCLEDRMQNEKKAKCTRCLEKRTQNEKKVDYSLRSFFRNNVIVSNRFNYVIRFINPKHARAIMENEALVSFVLREIDEKQIARYYLSVRNNEDPTEADSDYMRKKLVDKLMHVSFATFEKVSKDALEAVEKERLKALVGLYLTIIYLIAKALVRINTSYSIAFGIFERDCEIIKQKAHDEKNASLEEKMKRILAKKKKKSGSEPEPEPEYRSITQYFDERGRINRRVKRLIERNSIHYDERTFRQVRNCAEHLSVVSSFHTYVSEIKRVESYFDLYHYILLRVLKDGKFIKQEATLKGYEAAVRHQTAYKDFLYGILAPFAYNQARYINLACKKKFIESYGK